MSVCMSVCMCVCGQLLKNPDREREHREKSSRGAGQDDNRKLPGGATTTTRPAGRHV